LVAKMRNPSPRSGWTFAVSSPGGFWRAREGSTLLAGSIKGPAATRFRESGISREALAPILSRVFPWVGTDVIEWLRVEDWAAEPYSLGGYTYPRVGRLDQPETWAAAVGNTVFFAGESTCAGRHQAMVHGALESGIRAAKEVTYAFSTGGQP